MIDLVLDARKHDLGGGFQVGRALPSAARRMVGPFVFFDHFGPATFHAGFPKSVDVRPHPHIGLSTVSYLFDGEITHRDSLATEAVIRPGEVNWMTAGRGITHSERFETLRERGGKMHGIQAWVALPTDGRGRRTGLRPPRRRGPADLRVSRPVGAADRRQGLWRGGQG